ncbi:MAG: DUF3325 domain-containing protein [Sphingobium sp.]|nr:DUF3325 domain-containing protein [Sphingobium sp.]
MIDALIFLLSFAGFILLLLAMTRHQQDWLGRKLSPAAGRIVRLSGFAMLILAFAVAGAGLGWGYGSVVYFGWLTMSAACVVTMNINRERIVRKIRL